MMEKEEIIRILDDWNFWKKKPDTGIPRSEYIKRLSKFLQTNQIIVISGVRRSGKSYIMKQLTEYLLTQGIQPEEILFINFEDPRFTELNTQFLQRVYEVYIEYFNPKKIPYIFLDEVQEVEQWEKWVTSMQELKKAHIIISGSNAKLLSRELATLLTGRHIDQQIFPLSFREYLIFNNLQINDELDIIRKKTEILSHLRNYLEFGSFPGVILNERKKDMLLTYYDDLLLKDIMKRNNIRKENKLRELSNFYISNVSSLTTFGSMEKFLDISADTIEKYSYFFESAYLFFFLKRFSFKMKEQEKSPRKLYVIDTGLANMVGFRFTENIGKIAENIVFLELKRRQAFKDNLEIFYWKDEQHREVDFLIKENLNVTQLIQVCWNLNHPKVKERELRILIKALNVYNLSDGVVITEDFESKETIKGKNIYYKPLWKWLLTTDIKVV